MGKESSIAIGNFDGLHLGHQQIIETLIHHAKESATESIVITLNPNPKVYFGHESALMFSDSQKAEMLRAHGVDRVVFENFLDIINVDGEHYIRDRLYNELGMRHIVVGYNFKFGKGREYGTPELQKIGLKLGFDVTVIPPFIKDGERISSSLIREKLKNGHAYEAAKFLGHEYFIDGIVIRGEGRGKTLGFPTINIKSDNQLVPLGVFESDIKIKSRIFRSVTNVGVNPTFAERERGGEEKQISIETHILNFDKSAYGDQVRLFFKKKLRDEKKFSSKEELINQIKRDISLVTIDKF